MYLRLMPNLLHFLPDLGALYAVRPSFMKSSLDVLFHDFMVVCGDEPSFRKEVVILLMNRSTLGKCTFMLFKFIASLFFRVICEMSGKWLTRFGCYNALISLIDNS